MPPGVTVTRSVIDSGPGRAPCVGYLFLPREAPAPVPCVVLGHGFTGTQDRLRGSAEHFAARGMAALTFDYRGFGESGGEPRQVVSVKAQLADFRAAVAHVRGLPGIDPDRVGVWGSSLGGGHAITLAAEDPRIAAVVAQVPFNGFPKRVEGRPAASTAKLLAAMVRDAVRGRLGRPPLYVKAVGSEGEPAVMAGSEARRTIEAMDSEQWENRVAPRSLLEMMRYRPGRVARRITAPALVCVGEFDRETTSRSQRQLAEGPRAELRRYPVAHFDFYRPDMRERLLEEQADFFAKALLA
ncbi:alpha/beta hydrolase [Streptomyces capparidis]